MTKFADHGVSAQSCLFGLDDRHNPEEMVTEALQSQPWESVIIGGGVRLAEDQLGLFERVINLIRRHAPDAAIAFNSAPSDTYEAAARCIEVAEYSLMARSAPCRVSIVPTCWCWI